MKLIPLEELHRQEITLHHLHAVVHHPVNLLYRQPPGGRPCSMLILMEEGRCRFEFSGKTMDIEPGAILYLPQGGHESYRGLEEKIRYVRIGFCMQDQAGESIRCSDAPILLHKTTDEEAMALCRRLPDAFLADSLEAYGLMYRLLSHLSRQRGRGEMNPLQKRLMPALAYLEKNCVRAIDAPELAKRCHLSETHFRRLFRECMGEAPMAYRNRLRVRMACRLLQRGQDSIGEIADQLGFESVYYFSRVFKEIMGESPAKWRKRQ